MLLWLVAECPDRGILFVLNHDDGRTAVLGAILAVIGPGGYDIARTLNVIKPPVPPFRRWKSSSRKQHTDW